VTAWTWRAAGTGQTERPGRPGWRRLVAVLTTAVMLSLLVAAPASAHTSLVATDPADGSTVSATPAAVVLTFSEPAVALGTQVVVTGPQGQASVGAAQLVDATVRQELVAGAPAGRYTVAWRVTSEDGHPISGAVSFTSTAAGGGTLAPDSAPAAGEPGGAGAPSWAWLVLTALVLGTAVTLAVVFRRRRPVPGT